MVSRRTLIGAAAAAVLLAGAAPHAKASQSVLIGGGSAGGLHTQAARDICGLVNEHAGGRYRCVARPAPGSLFNVRAVELGLMDFGLAQSDRIYEAVVGIDAWEGRPATHLRSVFGMYPETVLLVVHADAGIASVADLKGKTVSIGNPGTGLRGNAEDVLHLYGVDQNRDIEARALKPEEASRALALGTIDAFFCTVGDPAAAVAEAAAATPIAIVPIDSAAVGSFVAERPYYDTVELPPGTYSGVTAPVVTYAVTATVVTSAQAADDLVYDVVRTIFENLDALRDGHPAFRGLDPASMLEGLSAPLHPGAARYYRERGWL